MLVQVHQSKQMNHSGEGLLIMGKAVLVRGGGRLVVGREGVYGNSLYLPLSFVVNLKLLLKKKKKRNADKMGASPGAPDLSKHQNITHSLQVRPVLATMLSSSFPSRSLSSSRLTFKGDRPCLLVHYSVYSRASLSSSS